MPVTPEGAPKARARPSSTTSGVVMCSSQGRVTGEAPGTPFSVKKGITLPPMITMIARIMYRPRRMPARAVAVVISSASRCTSRLPPAIASRSAGNTRLFQCLARMTG